MAELPFTFSFNTFQIGINSQAATNTSDSSLPPSSSAAPPPPAAIPTYQFAAYALSHAADAFPANLQAPTLPPCTHLNVQVQLHPLRGRVLVSACPLQTGAIALAEHALLASNWDDFRCMECDLPHTPAKCPVLKQKYNKKFVKHLSQIQRSLTDVDCIGGMDHARMLLKMLYMHMQWQVNKGSSGAPSPLQDFMLLSYVHLDQCLKGIAEIKPVLEDVGVWPADLTDLDAAKIIAIINNNCHELVQLRGSGIFLRCALMEHACRPNANFVSHGTVMHVIALQPMQANTNITISYDENLFYMPVHMRRAALWHSHGFYCFCEACTSLPDTTRAFTCPNVSPHGEPCTGIVYPVSSDDEAQSRHMWQCMVSAVQGQYQVQLQSGNHSIPTQALSAHDLEYPAPSQYAAWSCSQCRHQLTAAQIASCQALEKESRRLLRIYLVSLREKEEEAHIRSPRAFNFDRKQTSDHMTDEDSVLSSDDEDDDEDDGGGEEMPSPQSIIDSITRRAAPTLHPTHYLIFFAVDYYAHLCASDTDFAADAQSIFERLIAEYLPRVLPRFHEQYVIYYDMLGQVCVAQGKTDEASAAFHKAHDISAVINGEQHHTTRDLYTLYTNTPSSTEELAMHYHEMEEKMDELLYSDDQEAVQMLQQMSIGGKAMKDT